MEFGDSGVIVDSNYTVVFTGRLVAGREEAQVKSALADLFKTTAGGVEQLFAKAPVAIKKDVDRDTAIRYKAAVEKLGALCEVESSNEPALDSDGALTQEHSSGSVTAALAEATSATERDIYSPPEADVEAANWSGDRVLVEPRRVTAADTWQWTVDAFGSFKDNPLAWIGIVIVWVVMIGVLSFIPIANIATYVLQPMFIGGLMLGCRAQDTGSELEFRHLFAGFSHNAGKLAGLGGLYLGSLIVLFLGIMIVAFVVALIFGGGFDSLGTFLSADANTTAPPAAAIAMFVTIFVLALAGMFVIIAGFVFSPALLVLHDVEIFDAVKLSIRGCFINWLPFLIWGLIWFALMILAMIPLGLGYLVVGPMMIASLYFAYRSIFTAAEA